MWGNPEGGSISIANQQQIYCQQQREHLKKKKERDDVAGAPMETGSAAPGKVTRGTKCALASGHEDGDEMRGAKLPVLGNKAVRRA